MVEASGSALGGSTVARLIENAQKSVEATGFAARKGLMQFDNVLADQRNAVFALRDDLLASGAKGYVLGCAMHGLKSWVAQAMPDESLPETWDAAALKKELLERYGLNLPLVGWVTRDELAANEISELVLAAVEKEIGASELSYEQCLNLAFDVLDEFWTEHLMALAELRENVSLKGHTGFNQVSQYHKDAFALFKAFEGALNAAFAEAVLKPAALAVREDAMNAKSAMTAGQAKVAIALERRWVTRNEACPCGSGKRFKECHGTLTS